MITADQIILHAIGDYILQSDWMAQNKTKQIWIASCHALAYSIPFLLLKPSLIAWFVIYGTHVLIDRYRLARYVVWVKNFLAPRGTNPAWGNCSGTGYPAERIAWMSVWLMIFADNIMHIVINGAALRWL